MKGRLIRYVRRYWRRIGLSLIPLLTVFFYSLGYFSIGALDRLEGMVFDARLRATMSNTLDDRIVIVDVDEKSLAELGRWPWPRQKMADLTQSLFQTYDVALVGFDVVFAESDDSSGLKQLEALAERAWRHDTGFAARLKQIAPALDNDAMFARSLDRRSVVLGYYFSSEENARTSGELPLPVVTASALQGRPAAISQWHGFGGNIKPLSQAAPLAGFFNSMTDTDGVVRALPLVGQYLGHYYESLALAMFRRLTGLPQVTLGFASATANSSAPAPLVSVVLQWSDKSLSIPVDQRGAVLVPFRGPGGARGGSFNYLSASDVLAGRVPVAQLKGRIALVGTTAPGIGDVRATPVAAVYPGLEVQANALAALLDQRFLVKSVYAAGYEVLLVLVTGLVLAVCLPLLRAPAAMLTSVAVMVALVWANWWMFQVQGVVLSLAPILLMTLAIAVLNVGYGYLVASRSRRDLIALFGTYVPPELVQEMIKDPDRYSMRARSEELTVMFCDMRGFTGISEQMTPAQLQQFLNRVFSELTRLIGNNRGTVDKYMGDCVMAFWGAPVESPAHAQLAVETAVQMTQALSRINHDSQLDGAVPGYADIQFGIGINTGQMYVGDMGSNIRRSYTVIGDAVNLGSRLEGLSKVYGVGIVVSESTQRLASNYVWQELDRVRVKGKQQAIAIYSPVARQGQLSTEKADELALWRNFLSAYRSQDWPKSAALLAQLQQLSSSRSGLYTLYAQRIAAMRDQPVAPDWDGITNFESK